MLLLQFVPGSNLEHEDWEKWRAHLRKRANTHEGPV